jgi:hypothetical protein
MIDGTSDKWIANLPIQGVEAWDLAGNVTRREFDEPSRFIPFPKKTT